jgi:hypothetical protein
MQLSPRSSSVSMPQAPQRRLSTSPTPDADGMAFKDKSRESERKLKKQSVAKREKSGGAASFDLLVQRDGSSEDDEESYDLPSQPRTPSPVRAVVRAAYLLCWDL